MVRPEGLPLHEARPYRGERLRASEPLSFACKLIGVRSTMRFTSLSHLLLIAAVGLACSQGSDDRARERLTSALSDSLGKNADPSVGFVNNRKHLQVSLSAARFAESSDSAFAAQAREIAKFALERYENARGLDSVTVLDREPVSNGVWRMRHMRTFPVDDLRSVR